jgi:hypothetical protein
MRKDKPEKQEAQQPTEEEVLRRMLNTPPKPKAQKRKDSDKK